MAAPPAAVTVASNQLFTHDLWDNGPAALDDWMRNPPHAVLAQTVVQSIANNVAITVSFDTTIRDNYNGHGPAGGTGDGYTAKAAGTYFVQAVTNLAWGGAAGKVAGAYLTVNNQTTWAVTEIPASPGPVRFQHSIAALIPMGIGDFVQLRIFQNSGSAQATGFVATGCRMSARWIAL